VCLDDHRRAPCPWYLAGVVVVCTVLAAGEMGEEKKTRRAGGKKPFMQLTHTHHHPT